MHITLKDCLKLNYFPKLSNHTNYSDLFEKQYDRLRQDLIRVFDESKKIYFYCKEQEFSNFTESATEGLLFYKDKRFDFDNNFEFLVEYSQFFEKGFDSISHAQAPSTIINHVPVCYPAMCLCIEDQNRITGVIPVGRKNSNSKPCIGGRRQFSIENFMGQGILRYKKYNHETKIGELSEPSNAAFKDGLAFKSVFLTIERYTEFSHYFESTTNNDFVSILLKATKELQEQDLKASCIQLIKNEGKKDESSFRYWYKTHLSGIYQHINAEPEKGNGRIDLKINDEKIGEKIIEFKGWWNNDKKQVINQITSYLTDFVNDGYIILINHTKGKNIKDEYLNIIQSKEMNYVQESYTEKTFEKTDFKYFHTEHNDGIRTKILTHIILNIY